jgi:hypothetical protein
MALILQDEDPQENVDEYLLITHYINKKGAV